MNSPYGNTHRHTYDASGRPHPSSAYAGARTQTPFSDQPRNDLPPEANYRRYDAASYLGRRSEEPSRNRQSGARDTGTPRRAVAADSLPEDDFASRRSQRQDNAARARRANRPQSQRAPQQSAPSTARNAAAATRRRPPLKRFALFGGIAVALVVAVCGAFAWQAAQPITVIVNGFEVKLAEARTLDAAFEAAGKPASAGNLYDIEGQLLEEGGGSRYAAVVNGADTTDGAFALKNGDTIVFTNGADAEEPSTVAEGQTIECNVVEIGRGPIHSITEEGSPGIATVKTGSISGKSVTTEITQEPTDRVYRKWYPDTNGEKVIALTFDDGPWDGTTNEILDVLAENNAKATFFTIGRQITGARADTVQRAVSEGHQVCTHSFDHASGSGQGVNLAFMSPEEQRWEIDEGLRAISNASGQPASTVFRAPGGNFPLEVWRNVEDQVVAEIGWDIDSFDWKKPGVAAIAAAIKGATPGDVVLLHDGGGDRSQTVEALREALPYLKEQGYAFITIDELMKYPPKEA